MAEMTITSQEAAGMAEVEHANLKKSIERHINSMRRRSINPDEYFREESYENRKGYKSIRYLITYKGCEYLAQKMEFSHGSEFAARYEPRFKSQEAAEERTTYAPAKQPIKADGKIASYEELQKENHLLKEILSEVVTEADNMVKDFLGWTGDNLHENASIIHAIAIYDRLRRMMIAPAKESL